MLLPLAIIVFCAAAIIGGLALAAVAPGFGAGIAVTGIVVLGGFFVFAYLKAWRNGQGDYYTPGKGYREYHEELRAAKEAEEAAKRRDR